jgi:hypothetical protein
MLAAITEGALSMTCRIFLIPLVAIAASLSCAYAADGPTPADKPLSVSGPTAAEFLPMTRSERLRNYLLTIVGVEPLFRSITSAAIRQVENSPKEWQGRAAGFGYRVGDAYAQHVIRSTLTFGASSLLHQDNRYFASGQQGFFRRAKYAVASTFLARKDNGDRQISFSRLGGAAGAAFISRIWQPPSTTSAGDGAVSFGISMGSDVGLNLVKEFLPGLGRHLRKR